MTKAEAIAKTEYTEEQLIDLALTFALTEMRKYRDENQDDIEAWEHYENLRAAFTAIQDERTNSRE
jgi:hypothetical protein